MITFVLSSLFVFIVVLFAAVIYKAFKMGNALHRKLNLWLKY